MTGETQPQSTAWTESTFHRSRRITRPLALEIALNSALILCIVGVILLVRAKDLTFGSARGGWVYPYIGDFQPFALLTGVGLSFVLVLYLHMSLDLIDRYQLRVIALWFVLGTVGQLVLHSLYHFSLGNIVQSNWANGFYNASRIYTPRDILSRFDTVRQHPLSVHVGSNMPGKILLYHALGLLTEDPRGLAILIVALSSLGGILLYFIVSAVFGDRRVALFSLVLYLFIPGRTYFLPLLNTVSPVPILTCLLLLVRFLAGRRRILAVLLGMGLYVALLLDPVTLSLGLFFLALLARSWWSAEVDTADVLWLVILAPAGFVVVHLAMWLGFRFDVIHRFTAVSADAYQFAQGRPYKVWIWANLWEFFLSAGVLPSIFCLIYFGIGVVKAIHSLGACSYRALASLLLVPPPLMLATLLITVAVLDLIAVNRSEVTRLWIFLAVFVQVAAAGLCGKAHRWTMDILLAGSVIQTAVTIAMVGFVLP